jgi:protein SCO1/2
MRRPFLHRFDSQPAIGQTSLADCEDGLSTTLSVLPPGQAEALLASYPTARAWFVDFQGGVRAAGPAQISHPETETGRKPDLPPTTRRGFFPRIAVHPAGIRRRAGRQELARRLAARLLQLNTRKGRNMANFSILGAGPGHLEGFDRRRFLVAMAAGAASLSFGSAGAHGISEAPVSGFELPQPKPLQPFVLSTHLGERFSAEDLRDRWSFVFFGFTSCPDVCPTAMMELSELRAAIQASNERVPTRVLFVTIDPARDTAERLAEYAAKFGPGVTALGGSEANLAMFAGQFRVRYEIANQGAPTKGGYLFDHTASVSLVGPDGRLYAVYTLPLRTPQVATAVLRIHDRHRSSICPSVYGSGEALACRARNT